MSPHYIAVRDGNAVAMPKDYPAAKEAPEGFQVKVHGKE